MNVDDFLEHHLNDTLIGVDEVGRGPLAGPVVCAGVRARPPWPLRKSIGINDSKKLTAKKRQAVVDSVIWEDADSLFNQSPGKVFSGKISTGASAYWHFDAVLFVGAPDFVDRENILRASLKGMAVCCEELLREQSSLPVLVDGNHRLPLNPQFEVEQRTLVKGDQKSILIGLASIFAKVFRDQLMVLLHEQYPVYGWDRNKGYGSKAHLEAIKIYGVTSHHRKSFAPVRENLSESKSALLSF